MKAIATGDPVVYFDSRGIKRNALVTIVWGNVVYDEDGNVTDAPGVNLVFVSGDESRDDSYGRQIERNSSVVHKGSQPAHGNYWDWPD